MEISKGVNKLQPQSFSIDTQPTQMQSICLIVSEEPLFIIP